MNHQHDTTGWPEARIVAARLREELAALGIPDEDVRQILPAADTTGRGMVRLGTVSVDSADRLAAALYAARAARARS